MHLLLSTTPIPAHTLNAAVFAAVCAAAGDTVTWHAPRRFHDAITALGAEPVDVEAAWDPDRDSGGVPVMGSVAQVRRGYADHIVGRAEGRARDVLSIIERTSPDIVLADTLAYGAGLAAQVAGLPWATYGDGPLHDRDPDTPPFGSGLPYRTGATYRLRNAVVHHVSDLVFAESARSLQMTRTRLGLPPEHGAVLAAGVCPDLHLQGGVPALEYPRRLPTPPGIHFLGSLYRRPPGTAVPAWCADLGRDGRPVVAITQGSLRRDVAELIDPTVRAMADEDCTLVVAAGSERGARQVRAIPTGRATVYAAAYVPYDALVAGASVFVTNGGWTGVTTALAHGVPVLQVGHTEEKADIGRRIEWSGCGLSLRRGRRTPARIRRAIHDIRDDPAIAAGVARVEAEFAVRDAGTQGAALLCTHAARTTPTKGRQ